MPLLKEIAVSPSSSVDIYLLSSRNELNALLDRHKAVRVLYNGSEAYAWQADMADHQTIRRKLGFSDEFFGFMIDHSDGDKILQGWAKNPDLVKKFREIFL
ncbi:MAG: hypothetical protein IJ660_03450 [Alphaproteobacteria bacterium]|nr:hypothetical protein [Alphaproteobacteria bacterium]